MKKKKNRPCRKKLFCLYCTVLVLAPVVQMLDSAIHQINHFPVDTYVTTIRETDCIIYWLEIYPLNNIIPAFEVLGPGRRVQPLPLH